MIGGGKAARQQVAPELHREWLSASKEAARLEKEQKDRDAMLPGERTARAYLEHAKEVGRPDIFEVKKIIEVKKRMAEEDEARAKGIEAAKARVQELDRQIEAARQSERERLEADASSAAASREQAAAKLAAAAKEREEAETNLRRRQLNDRQVLDVQNRTGDVRLETARVVESERERKKQAEEQAQAARDAEDEKARALGREILARSERAGKLGVDSSLTQQLDQAAQALRDGSHEREAKELQGSLIRAIAAVDESQRRTAEQLYRPVIQQLAELERRIANADNHIKGLRK